MTLLEDDLLEDEFVSLCAECAKDKELRALVDSDLGKGVCGVCCKTEVPVFNPARFQNVVNLIRSLIRFNFDESDYNSHWGGTSVHDLLLENTNPILKKSSCDNYADVFIEKIEWDGGVSPDYNDGICLYAGFDDRASRLIQFSIPNAFPTSLADFRKRLKSENFYAIEPDLDTFVSKLTDDLESRIEKDSIWYRARTGVEKVLKEHDGGFYHDTVFVPFTDNQIGALPPPRVSLGRMNRAGVSVLYVANQIETAISEIRPHPGHHISVAGFKPVRDLRVAKFNVSISDFCASDSRLDLFAEIYHIDSLMSEPVIPESRHRYLLTQLLSEALIKKGFDAVSFRSSVGSGQNLCAFNPKDFLFDEGLSEVKRIDALEYRISSQLSVLTPGPEHYEIQSPEL